MVFKARVKLRSCHLSPYPKESALNVECSDLTLRNIVSGCKELLFGLGRWLTQETRLLYVRKGHNNSRARKS